MLYSIKRLRQVLVEELKDYEGKPITLPFDSKLIEELLFNKYISYKEFDNILIQILPKMNYENVNFKLFNAVEFNFSELQGIKIDPQTIANKNLFGAICKGVEFIGTFDDVNVKCTDFTDSKGAKIYPQRLRYKSLENTICADVEFKGSIEGVNIEGTNFNGSNLEEAIMFEQNFRKKIKVLTHANNID